MTRTTFKSFINTEFDNGYAQAFIAFVVLSAVLFVFNLLGAWDPAVMKLPLWYAKLLYAIGGVSGIIVYMGMALGYLSFRNRWPAARIKIALLTEILGLSFHIFALLALAISTLTFLSAAIWIAPTTLFLALPHLQLLRRLISEWAKFDYKEEQYASAVRLVGVIR